jgi:LPS sulfotransferase NodH
MLNAGTDDQGFFSMKIMYKPIQVFNRCLVETYNWAGVSNPFLSLFKDCTFLYIKRENVLKEAISYHLAEQRGIFH